jgi:type III secretion apparatus needle protein
MTRTQELERLNRLHDRVKRVLEFNLGFIENKNLDINLDNYANVIAWAAKESPIVKVKRLGLKLGELQALSYQIMELSAPVDETNTTATASFPNGNDFKNTQIDFDLDYSLDVDSGAEETIAANRYLGSIDIDSIFDQLANDIAIAEAEVDASLNSGDMNDTASVLQVQQDMSDYNILFTTCSSLMKAIKDMCATAARSYN